MATPRQVTILLAEDSPSDGMLLTEALEEQCPQCSLHLVQDGVELLEYLHHEGAYHDPGSSPRPDLILLDLNMPRKTGLEALEEIKADPQLRAIPVVVLSTSSAASDKYHSYDLGASSYIVKPVNFDEVGAAMATLNDYWLHRVQLPPRDMSE